MAAKNSSGKEKKTTVQKRVVAKARAGASAEAKAVAKPKKKVPVKAVAKPKKSVKPRAHKRIAEILLDTYPGENEVLCELDFETPFQLLIGTILAAQSTDVRVNLTTPALFAKYPDAESLAAANLSDVETLIHSTGFYRNKAKNIVAMSQRLMTHFGGEVPTEMEDLVTLPGVGRKTANVLRSVALGLPGLAVDTHVTRLSGLLGLTKSKDPVVIEQDLCAELDESEWGAFSLRLVLHGRRVCIARRPRCGECVLARECPSRLY